MEAGDPTDSPKDARLEDQRALRVPAALDDPHPEVRQHLQKPSGPATGGEVVQRQVAGMVQAWVAQKLVKCDISRVFTMSDFINI